MKVGDLVERSIGSRRVYFVPGYQLMLHTAAGIRWGKDVLDEPEARGRGIVIEVHQALGVPDQALVYWPLNTDRPLWWYAQDDLLVCESHETG